MIVSVSPNGTNHYQGSSPSNEVLVATRNGVVSLSRTGPSAPWREARRMLEDKHAGAIAVEPGSGASFVGTHGDGLWASEDNGQTWQRRDSGIASDNIYGLNCTRVDGEVRIYAGTEPAHLYVSKDVGKSWTELPALLTMPSKEKWTFPGAPHEAHVKNIVFDPRDANTFYVGVEVGGAFRTRDAGRTFHEMGGFYEDVHRLMTVPSRADDVYMSTGKYLYHSPNGGDSWEEMALPERKISYPDSLVIAPDRPDLMFTAGSAYSPGEWRTTKDADARIARSRDAGRTWEYLAGGLPSHLHGNVEAMTMDVFPGGFSLFAATTDGDVYFSDNEGDTWTTIAQGLPPISKSGHFRNLREDLVAAH